MSAVVPLLTAAWGEVALCSGGLKVNGGTLSGSSNPTSPLSPSAENSGSENDKAARAAVRGMAVFGGVLGMPWVEAGRWCLGWVDRRAAGGVTSNAGSDCWDMITE